MTREEVKEIQLKLAVFSFGRLQELVTLFNVLEREGLTLEDVKEFIAATIELQKASEDNFRKMLEAKKKEWERITRKCPDCGKPLDLVPVREKEGKTNKFGYKSYWSCSGEECLFEEYSKVEINKIVEKLRGR